MKILEIIKSFGKYTLLKTDAKYQPYVVAWCFNGSSWGQGHYFCTLQGAKDYFSDRVFDYYGIKD